ncbi:hypothetical protein RDI58_029547 [Solanum bulbocastanum]|uniref:F-box associated beta-propeller type 3 domain-containing protein n=1 Tax=Solanum bulbocastanum TaxID=147425 RepID=A0AAN8SXS0_SOLBU
MSLATNVPRVLFGFGFHPVTKEYKLIKITSRDPGFNSNVGVLTLGSNRWRSIAEIPYEIHPNTQGIMLNGKMHWLACLRDYNGPLVIVSFDLADEVFGEVPQVDFGLLRFKGMPNSFQKTVQVGRLNWVDIPEVV